MNKRSRHTSLVGGYARSSLGIQLAYLYKVEEAHASIKSRRKGALRGVQKAVCEDACKDARGAE
ncbi:MAG: hypothetical protein M3316_07220 [Actinomycetota bacterium]|nr:hypothetical protein [Actinomycetota bacterium]